MTYTVHTVRSASVGARETLAAAEKNFGFVPNLLGIMAEAPALVKAYTTLSRIFDETSFSPAERQVVLLTASYENGCMYCVAAHSVLAAMQKVPGDVIAAIRDGAPIADHKLEALRQFTSAVTSTRGRPSGDQTNAFLNAGYAEAQVLEVILGVEMKTLSNYTNHVAGTPLDPAFARAALPTAA